MLTPVKACFAINHSFINIGQSFTNYYILCCLQTLTYMIELKRKKGGAL